MRNNKSIDHIDILNSKEYDNNSDYVYEVDEEYSANEIANENRYNNNSDNNTVVPPLPLEETLQQFSVEFPIEVLVPKQHNNILPDYDASIHRILTDLETRNEVDPNIVSKVNLKAITLMNYVINFIKDTQTNKHKFGTQTSWL